MLTFFRKYQKIFFIIVTIVTVSSFVFFGTYETFVPSRHLDDPVEFKTVTGRPIRRLYLEKLSRILGSETVISGDGNIFNQDFLSKDILEPGFAPLIYQNLCLHDETEAAKLERERGFVPYVHPNGRYLSFERIWQMMGSKMGSHLRALKSSTHLNEAFSHRVALYLEERKTPPQLVEYIIRSKEKEYHLPPDLRLERGNLSLFGYKHAEDWFGKSFIQECATLIVHGADQARALGYKVSKSEVGTTLSEHVKKMAATYPGMVTQGLIARHMMDLQVSENELMALYEDIFLFRRWMQDIAGSVIPDNHTLATFKHFASDQIDLELYQIPDAYRIKNDRDANLFSAYLTATAGWHPDNPLPESFDSVDIIEKKAPELIRQVYTCQMASVDVAELHRSLSLKQIWDWQLDPANWNLLTDQFALLKSACDDESKKEAFLTHCTFRSAIDKFAAEQIVKAHPEWIEKDLNEKPLQTRRLVLDSLGHGVCLAGISDAKAFVEALEGHDALACYTQDGNHFYRIEKKEKHQPEMVEFSTAVQEGILSALVKKEEQELADCGKLSEHFRQFLIKQAALGEVHMPWGATKEILSISRAKPCGISFEEANQLELGMACPPQKKENGDWYFYKVVGKRASDASVEMSWLALQRSLAEPLQKEQIAQLVATIKERRALVAGKSD